uniref:Uncharacterized protein n=1 Tax=Ochrobactrum phage ORM_20 TaxID=2985243 RepID=A0A9N6ZG86_9VIRU|nr:hypothetical protein ORM20_00047 [Ochrobactrum phage ORM_20]
MEENQKERIRILYRCWKGYSLFFATGKMKFDDNHVPIIKVPDLDLPKHKFLTINMRKALSNIHSDLFPLYFVSIGIRRFGVIPQPFKELGPREVDFLKEAMKYTIMVLANLRNEWLEKKDENFTYETLVEAAIKGNVSVPFAVMYMKKHSLEKFDTGQSEGLQFMQVSKIIDACYKLEMEHSFFAKNNLLAVRVANLWKEMGET